MDGSGSVRTYLVPVVAMAAVVLASNVLVQFPVHFRFGAVELADLLTWGAFTYPAAFLVTDLTNRQFGARRARHVVYAGFVLAVALSVVFATVRIALASGAAFLVAQLLDVYVFDRLRRGTWWRAPLVSSVLGSLVDTALFFSLAFAAAFSFIAASDPFTTEPAPLLSLGPMEAPRWVSWALGDLAVKLLVAVSLLAPYRLALRVLPARMTDGAAA